MSLNEQVLSGPVETLEFQTLTQSGKLDVAEMLVKDYGVVYVTAITRDGCSGCAEQKPLFRELASKMSEKHLRLVSFRNIHVRYEAALQQDSWEAKRLFGHAAYPTYMVHVKSHKGPLEVYRAVYPTMEELEKQAGDAFELAQYYKAEASKL